jgi:hypothetical protein
MRYAKLVNKITELKIQGLLTDKVKIYDNLTCEEFEYPTQQAIDYAFCLDMDNKKNCNFEIHLVIK